MTDDDLSEDALAAMGHGELVKLLNRLYARAGEPPAPSSTTLALTVDELRDRVQSVRRRIRARADRATRADAPPPRPRPAVSSGPAGAGRVLVALVAADTGLVNRARATCRTRGVPLVSASSVDALATLAASVTPSDLVIDASAHAWVTPSLLADLRVRGVRVWWCESDAQTIEILVALCG
ncbi:MAG: hypothetical protein K8M05_38540 [Deltaproteobacteria bacterium]|nr:hypothetical protein [Kofleriaceae bacterium]